MPARPCGVVWKKQESKEIYTYIYNKTDSFALVIFLFRFSMFLINFLFSSLCLCRMSPKLMAISKTNKWGIVLVRRFVYRYTFSMIDSTYAVYT